MFATVSRWFAGLAFVLASLPAATQPAGTIDFDRSFGNDGFAVTPQIPSTTPGNLPLGFVHLPQSGNYLLFSVQLINGAPKIVSSRMLENGAFDPGYGSNGFLSYALPVPDGVGGGHLDQIQWRLVVGVQPGGEVVHLVYKFGGVNLAIARVTANGTLIDFAGSNLPVNFALGAGLINDVMFGSTFGNNAGLVIIVRGNGAEIDRTALVQFQGGTIFEPFGMWLTRPGLRLNRILLRTDGATDLVGTASGKAVYFRYDPRNNTLGSEGYFDLNCSNSTATASVIDDIVRDAPLGSDAFVIGRAYCSGGGVQMIAGRVAHIEALPLLSGLTSLSDDLGGCSTLTEYCLVATAQMSHGQAGRVYVTTTTANLAFVEVGNGAPNLGASYPMTATDSANPFLVLPTRKYGSYQGYPGLTGIAYRTTDGAFGMGRMIVTSLLSNGFED